MSHPLWSWRQIVIIAVVLAAGAVVLLSRFFPDGLDVGPDEWTIPAQAATVNGEAVTRDMVEAEIKISRLNVLEPLPPLTGEDYKKAAEEAVNQLVTRHLVLQAASRQSFVLDDAFIEDRVNLLFGSYGQEALNEALDQAGASRTDLAWWVREIVTVEEFTRRVIMANARPEERQQVYNDWLNAQRAKATIETSLNGAGESLPALIGEPAPDFTLNNLHGQPVSLSDHTGKVVLVNFWATWCPSCISEMPEYEQVYQQHGGDGARFLVLGVNLQEGPDTAAQFAGGLGVTFPVLMDQDGQVTNRQYQVTGMPASFIVDRQGRIFYRHLGPMSAETLQTKLAELGL